MATVPNGVEILPSRVHTHVTDRRQTTDDRRTDDDIIALAFANKNLFVTVTFKPVTL